MLIGLVYTPGLCEVFHTARFAARRWLFLLVWPLAVFGLAEAVKALARPRAARDSAATGGELRSEGSG